MTEGRLDCDTCGKPMPFDSHLCGECATDWNDRDQHSGIGRINRRRKRYGLKTLVKDTLHLQCPICGADYALPLDGDSSRRCPTCGSPARATRREKV